METLVQLLASLGLLSVVLVPAIPWLVRRLEKEIDRRLENRQAERIEAIKAEYQMELQRLESVEQRITSQIEMAFSRGQAINAAAAEKRISAVEHLWQAFRLRVIASSMLAHIDDNGAINNYVAAWKELEAEVNAKNHFRKLLEVFTDSSPLERPFVTESLWTYFHAYDHFISQVWVHLFDEPTKSVPWHHNSYLCEHLRLHMPEEDYTRVMSLPSDKLAEIRRFFEARILHEMRRVLSGEVDSAETLERVHQLQRASEHNLRPLHLDPKLSTFERWLQDEPSESDVQKKAS